MAMSRALLPPVSREAPLCSSRAATWGWLFRMAWVRGVRPWHYYYIDTNISCPVQEYTSVSAWSRRAGAASSRAATHSRWPPAAASCRCPAPAPAPWPSSRLSTGAWPREAAARTAASLSPAVLESCGSLASSLRTVSSWPTLADKQIYGSRVDKVDNYDHHLGSSLQTAQPRV